ncbi:MAG TPA: methyltransferase domain-containing protein [Myxococcota bacterium]|nr:methyltransferase domain-containing protein [Myxococcota bacterium]
MRAPRSLLGDPDRELALAEYAELASRYDATCTNIWSLREAAIAALAPRPGETVFDVACGTGASLPKLAAAVGASGRVIGIEQSPPMAAQALERIRGLQRIEIVRCSIQDLAHDARADAMLFCYTHDVLQSRRALEVLRDHAKPGCRVAVLGVRTQPWWWGLPLNVFTMVRARRYFTTFRGLQRPWEPLAAHCPDLRPVRHFHIGTSYLALGRFPGARPQVPGWRANTEVRPPSPTSSTS